MSELLSDHLILTRPSSVHEKMEDIDAILDPSLGLIACDLKGVVASRAGTLARWAPPKGGDIFSTSVLWGMNTHIAQAVIAERRRETLHEVTLEIEGVSRVFDIEIHWDASAQRLLFAVYDASERISGIIKELQNARTRNILREADAGMRGIIVQYRSRLETMISRDPEVSHTSAIQRLWRYENIVEDLQRQIDLLAA